MSMRSMWRPIINAAVAAALAAPAAGWATVARMQTVSGVIDVQLYGKSAPLTVANFLNYVKAAAYDGTFLHRSVPGFVVQGGGFKLVGNTPTHITENAKVKNEFSPTRSNLRGTVAMAKLGGDPNSATSEWFFNLANNAGKPAYLDSQNGGFTVFGRVVGAGMKTVDAIAALPTADLGGAFTNLPYNSALTNGGGVQISSLIYVNKVSISEPAKTSDADRVFGYLEAIYPIRFAPVNPLYPVKNISKSGSGYYYRYYATTKKYLAIKAGKVYWGSALKGTMTEIGALSTLLASASKLGY